MGPWGFQFKCDVRERQKTVSIFLSQCKWYQPAKTRQESAALSSELPAALPPPFSHSLSCLFYSVIYYFFFIFPLIFDDLKHYCRHCAIVCFFSFINQCLCLISVKEHLDGHASKGQTERLNGEDTVVCQSNDFFFSTQLTWFWKGGWTSLNKCWED